MNLILKHLRDTGAHDVADEIETRYMISHVSATSIKLFRSCLRRWYERYILGKREPTSKAMTRGNEVHRQLEQYLLHGEMPDDSPEGLIAQAGLEHLPAPPYQVELSLEHLPIEGTPAPFKGFIDMYITGDTPEILDHKTTSNFKYALTAEQLAVDPQLIIYAGTHCTTVTLTQSG